MRVKGRVDVQWCWQDGWVAQSKSRLTCICGQWMGRAIKEQDDMYLWADIDTLTCRGLMAHCTMYYAELPGTWHGLLLSVRAFCFKIFMELLWNQTQLQFT